MAAARQAEGSFGEPPFSGFKLTLREPGMGEARPEIRSDDLITDRLPLLIHRHHSTLSLREKASTMGRATGLKHYLINMLFFIRA